MHAYVATTCAKKKTDKNMKRLCKIYGPISTDFYRKAMPISKINLNLTFLTKLGCGVRIEVPRQAIYAFSKVSYTKYICHYKIS